MWTRSVWTTFQKNGFPNIEAYYGVTLMFFRKITFMWATALVCLPRSNWLTQTELPQSTNTKYQLPHHLKEVSMDYVKKLLAAGVIRKSNSVFIIPLMLVKKPHADPNKPLAEQYRLVHDLSQGFFQQHLIDPHEATLFSIPGLGQFSYCRSPQGMNSSPAYFQHLLDFVLQGISRVNVYIDDVVVSVKTNEENLEKLTHIFPRFCKHHLEAFETFQMSIWNCNMVCSSSSDVFKTCENFHSKLSSVMTLYRLWSGCETFTLTPFLLSFQLAKTVRKK